MCLLLLGPARSPCHQLTPLHDPSGFAWFLLISLLPPYLLQAAKAKAGEVKQQAGQAAESAKESAKETAEHLRERAGEAGQAARERAGEMAESGE